MKPAHSPRISWEDLPEHVRAGIEDILQDTVVSADSQVGGFSPGTADRLVTATGRRAFAKAVSPTQNAASPNIHRDEITVTEALSAHAPDGTPIAKLIGSYDDGEWVALVLDDVEGRHARTPWVKPELDAVIAALDALASTSPDADIPGLGPASTRLAKTVGGWARIVDDTPDDLDTWCAQHLDDFVTRSERGLQALVGGAVVHTDIRADNALIRPDGTAVIIDWPWACRGPAWLDTLLVLVNVNLFGGHDMDELTERYLADVPPTTVTDLLIGISGFFVDGARQPPTPGIPTLREFQHVQGEATLRWVRQRLEAE